MVGLKYGAVSPSQPKPGVSEVAAMEPLGGSLMPEGLLAGLTDQQVRDLFAYLRSTQPLND